MLHEPRSPNSCVSRVEDSDRPMNRTFSSLALALLVCTAAQAASISTTLTVNATAAIAATGFEITGSANFTNGIGNGTVAATVPLSAIATDPAKTTFTITLTSGGTLTGTLSVPLSVLTGGATSSASVGVAVTGGTGTYAGATGTFTLTGSVSGSALTGFTFTNFTGPGTILTGGTPPPPSTTPTISAVQDAASNTPSIAQGSIFIVKGTNLSTSGYTPFAPPRPTVSSGGVKVTFTPAGGATGTDAYLVYLYNQSGVNQIAGILPSTVAVGNYNVTV